MKIIHVQTQIDEQSFFTHLSLDGFFNRRLLRGQGDQEMGYSGKRRSSQNFTVLHVNLNLWVLFLSRSCNWSAVRIWDLTQKTKGVGKKSLLEFFLSLLMVSSRVVVCSRDCSRDFLSLLRYKQRRQIKISMTRQTNLKLKLGARFEKKSFNDKTYQA